MRVTEKGQVTIPKPIRDKLGIGPGSEVEFVEREGNVVVLEARTSTAGGAPPRTFEEWADGIAGTLDLGGMTVDEYMEWLRGPRDDLDPR
jgi:AbrB family looped-hinge helix DNA binding protein